jgi:hypothetical protein
LGPRGLVSKETRFINTLQLESIINSEFLGKINSKDECGIYILDSRGEGAISWLCAMAHYAK